MAQPHRATQKIIATAAKAVTNIFTACLNHRCPPLIGMQHRNRRWRMMKG
jgi:hypothetical protein